MALYEILQLYSDIENMESLLYNTVHVKTIYRTIQICVEDHLVFL